MTILVTGDRHWWDYEFILGILEEWHERAPITLLVHGDCRGADRLSGKAAGVLGIPTDPMPADWIRHGRAAGPIRNRAMLSKHPEIDLVLAFHDSIRDSRGTLDMISIASRRGLAVALCSHAETIFPWHHFSLDRE